VPTSYDEPIPCKFPDCQQPPTVMNLTVLNRIENAVRRFVDCTELAGVPKTLVRIESVLIEIRALLRSMATRR
jgi:hypothetical protein